MPYLITILAWQFDISTSYDTQQGNLQSAYSGMGVSCSDVGSLDTSSHPNANSGCTDPSSSDKKEGLAGWAIALIVIFIVGSAAFGALALYYYREYKTTFSLLHDADANGHNHMHSRTEALTSSHNDNFNKL